MPRPPLPSRLVELLRRPNAAVMATVRSDGAPVTAATWYVWEVDGRVLVNLDESRVRLQHLRNDPRVSLTVLDENWYTHVTLIGRVTELRADEGLADIDRISRHYTGHEYANRHSPRASALIEVERWYGWGEAKAAAGDA
ncbi:TIGR03618 family F420-dependent PPOX class oxidoreductase [Cellulosimicrobium protaetiae]|uniref:TIGR03618 family F420-dependent PPOX class oxidoreductase n=1 Tax=Cellulosimicrobium protaetiae TaxID=2587808 RepID=A0A6M5UGJ9_9MICO|nr:TIGR03618 family F420-dependent PPOX class oxidoreductase [Cellulosimicrobium protaetiae]QJW37757.1 TIGR03618 family F420-dependent PPOX class oxidoreductase [Cellulosimicrobium protaetiae]